LDCCILNPLMAFKTFFSGGPIARTVHIRLDQNALELAWKQQTTRVVTIWRSRCLVQQNAAVLLPPARLGQSIRLADSIYLGQLEGQHIFATALDSEPAANSLDEGAFASFRTLMAQLPAEDAALLAYAKGMIEWQQRHVYCGRCGAPNRPESGGFTMVCTDSECHHRSFPRIDPAIIVLVTTADLCLLGRQMGWPAARYSTIAGFVEPGESLEDAVAREVHEETNVIVSHTQYMGSQPWPFPGAIMIGFHATAGTKAIELNDGELADARWFSRAEIATAAISLPPVNSIAFQLIESWFDAADGPRLRTLNLSSDFSRQTDGA
jgi:NAD+ diphosphatase